MASSTQTAANKPPTKRKKIIEPTLDDAFATGRDMMNRSTKKMGAIETEDRRFRELFGVGPLVALLAWQLLNVHNLVPQGGTFLHLMWTLAFLKVYPTETVLAGLCGGCDTKTVRKWIWLFVYALSNLEPYVVSQLFVDDSSLLFLLCC